MDPVVFINNIASRVQHAKRVTCVLGVTNPKGLGRNFVEKGSIYIFDAYKHFGVF
jgi:hypothetical protein